MGTLAIQIPNQYAKEGVAYSYTFPVGTFNGTNTYSAFVNRLTFGRKLPSWLTFNPATRTFSGTPTKWWQLETLQIVVQAEEAGIKNYSIFILTVGAAANTGKICWRSGDTPSYTINAANLSTFNAAAPTANQWVAIAEDVTKVISQALRDKIAILRGNNVNLVWLWSNINGLRAHQANHFDFDIVEAGETIAINGANGATRAFNPLGRLWRGLRGKEIYVTNYNEPVTINSRNWQDFQNVSAIRCNRANPPNDHMQDRHIRFIGQPGGAGKHTPFVNLHGIKLREGITWQIDGSNGYIEAAFIDVLAGAIGFHWKANTTDTQGDRRPWLNVNGWDMNQEHTYIHDCIGSSPDGTEIIYLGGGSWFGIDVNVLLNNDDGTPKYITVNGVQTRDYWKQRRFNNTHRFIRIEHNIFTDAGWDPIQTRVVSEEQRIMYNYLFRGGIADDVNNIQAEGIICDGGVGEVAYNYIEYIFFSAMRAGMLGLDSIHHNICVNLGVDNYGNPNLNAPQKGTGLYQSSRGLVTQDVPALHMANQPVWSSTTIYDYDNFQHEVKVQEGGKVWRSKDPNNQNHRPSVSPDWWEDTHEGDSYIAIPGLAVGTLFHKVFHNTFVNGFKTLVSGHDVPGAQTWYWNNLFINMGETSVNGKPGSNMATNIAKIGVDLATYFEDHTKKDFRLKAGNPEQDAGTNAIPLTNATYFRDGFLDFNGMAHDATSPAIGACEKGSPIGDHYVYVKNGLAGGGGGVVVPGPYSVDAGADISVTLPLPDGLSRTAVLSDVARVLTSILWEQLSGPNTLTLTGTNTLTVGADGFIQGTYVLRIRTVDVNGQLAEDSFSVSVQQMEVYSAWQWYYAADVAGAPDVANKVAIQGTNTKKHNPQTGLNRWYARGETPIAKSGNILGPEVLSNWIKIT